MQSDFSRRTVRPRVRRRTTTALRGGLTIILTLTMIAAGVAIAAPSSAATVSPSSTRPGQQACNALAAVVSSDRQVLSATSAIVPASASLPSFCDVRLVQRTAVSIDVGLPLNTRDGGVASSESVSGAWTGRVLNLGGGGYAGALSDLSFAIARNAVGSSTDTGHSAAWCNAINPKTGRPNSQPDCGFAGGGFVLDPQNKLLAYQVNDFIDRSLVLQTEWALKLTRTYYGRPAVQNYWVGASTGGRQGWQMAQQHAKLFDGFLVGFPAINWNRFIISEAWPAVVANELLGAAGLPPAKSDAANAAAVANCDAIDGVTDGVLADPRVCDFDATALICQQVPSDTATCLTPAEAKAINLIWDGPRDKQGGRLWGGIPRGTTFAVLLPNGTGMGALIQTYVTNWLYQDPTYDWRSKLTMENFTAAYLASMRKFQGWASTDDTNLNRLRASGAKVLFYANTSDPLINPFNSYNYTQRLFDRYGVSATKKSVRTFFFPNVGHQDPVLTGTQPARAQMLEALQNWVEQGQAPEAFVQLPVPGSAATWKVCSYPDVAANPSDPSSQCVVRNSVPTVLADASRTAYDRR